MSYFPLFVNMKNASCLVVGAGLVALRKVETLLNFGAEITVIAPVIIPEMQSLNVRIIQRNFEKNDLNGVKYVFAATDDNSVNRMIANECRTRHIMVNVADVPELCDFYFPALIKRGEAVIGISTGGRAPSVASILRQSINDLIPDNLENTIEELHILRTELLKQGISPKQSKEYKQILDKLMTQMTDVRCRKNNDC